MATVFVKTGVDDISFGVPQDEGNLVTERVSISRKIKKKDLRGKGGGYKAIASFDPTMEVTIDGAVKGGSSHTFALAGTATLTGTNDVFGAGVTLYVESITETQKNDDFVKVSVKLAGADNLD